MAMKLSIGSAVYNIDEPFLRAHIEGILPQLTEETELLLIDDCSTDNSGAVCREYAAKDSRVRYINMGVNGGLSCVRNRTIQEAQGEWIFFADADDLLSEHFIQTALHFCDAEADIIILDRLKFTQQIEPQEPCAVEALTALPAEAGRALSISCLCLDPRLSTPFGLSARAFYHAAWGALYRKSFLTANKLLFPEGQKKAQDSVFNTETYFYAQRIAYLPYVMYYYRCNPKGITQRYSGNLPQIFEALLKLLENDRQTLYADDADVAERFEGNRIMSVAIDNMRLNIFHKDNPKPREQSKKEFLEFVEQEPYNSAIARFDPAKSGRWEWHLPATLMKKRRFGLLNLFVGNPTAFRLLCGADKRVAKLFK